MNPIFQMGMLSLVVNKVNKRVKKVRLPKEEEALAVKNHLVDGFLIILGMLSAGFGLKGFLLPNGFIDGGVTGISLLLAKTTNIPLPILLIFINIPFIYLGYKTIARVFALKTISAIVGLSLCLLFIDYPTMTADKLLVAVFGGVFLGAGIGLAMRGGGVIDGTEILALTISRKTSMAIGDVILIINVLIFSAALFVLHFERALYSILTYFAATKTLDFIISGIEEHTGVTVISKYSEEIRKMIVEELGRGVTIYHGKGGYGNHGQQDNRTDIVFTVITRMEISRLKAEIEKIDDHAFVLMHSIKDSKGGMLKKKPFH